ncbi:type II secretion system protein GspG [Poritiphilus flavus]|uniref:Type II secretion system protein GspG C-terminal domain-containing protein n=1 Tax=Poritiphilus flavus TaxID=2697053 RepID=A0A6L9EDY2_9FLAO|nr:type II secretion system protein GspG [Poritiphilus flavus]NAS12897.1 hypothetical protein [Poritiphilus flavus]
MADLIAELLILFESLKFWKKKKERRRQEKDKKLPKKTMVHPTIWILLIALVLIFAIKFISDLFFPNNGISITEDKIKEIEKILNEEKNSIGKYPLKLDEAIRNNPLRRNIKIDAWGNEFHYKPLNNGLQYELKSKGEDGLLNTEDDIKGNQ